MQIPTIDAAVHEPMPQPPAAMPRLQLLRSLVTPGARRPERALGVETPKPDALAWEDTEIDIRRVVL